MCVFYRLIGSCWCVSLLVLGSKRFLHCIISGRKHPVLQSCTRNVKYLNNMVIKQWLNNTLILSIIKHKEGDQPLFVLLFARRASRMVMLASLYNTWCFVPFQRNPPMLVNDLFEDIKDGVMLIALLEVLSGQKLVRTSFLLNTHDSCITSLGYNFIICFYIWIP